MFDVPRLTRAVDNGLDGAAAAAKIDFEVTAQTWTNQPDITIESEPGRRRIGTDDTIYGYVNDGTKPHLIAPKNKKALSFNTPYGPKTSIGAIQSTAGSRGTNKVTTRKVIHHPGTAPRKFSDAIQTKWADKLPETLQRAIDSEAD